jgi:deoxyribonuclease-4
MVPLGSNRDRHAVLGEGEFGEKGCATFLSEPQFSKLPRVLETGTDHGAPSADDVALAFKLAKRGEAARKRAAAAKRSRGAKTGVKSG